uniref:Signal recognition particle subunit SRP72 n=1 Tax=Panagrolaimus sp. JU765 TaxID=591449 RepID=A0AC34QCZ2_9BILA
MATLSGAAALKPLIVELQKADTCGDYDRALKTANKIIRSYPKEGFAYKAKLVALIQLGQFDEAAEFISETPVAKIGNVAFENAYINYRKNNNEKALELLEKADQSNSAITELRAQIYYRMEKFTEAKEVLTNILKSSTDDDDTLRPLKLLDKALNTCKETMTADGVSEEDIDEELAVILVQKGFVLQKLGKNDEALKIYASVLEKNPSDANARASLLNNLPTTRKEVVINDARKRIKAASQIDKTKLSKRQQRVLLFNQALINLLSNQREPCRKTLVELQEKFGRFNEAVLVETALFVRQKDVQNALATLGKADPTAETQLLKAQILINSGHIEDGIQILQKLPNELKYGLAIVSLVVGLRENQNNESEIFKVLEEAENYWSKQKDVEKYHYFLTKAANVFSNHRKNEKAVEYLEKVLQNDSENLTVICRLIKLYGLLGSPKAEKLMGKLQPSSSEAKFNVDELEENDWILYGQKYKKKEGTKKEVEDTEIVTGKLHKRKRKRKIILPKNYDPNVPPDPERWLPKQERTAYKKKMHKKFREKDIGRGTQGAAMDSGADKMDYSIDQPGQGTQSSPSVTSPKPGIGPRQQGLAGKKKKPQRKR